MTTAFSCMTGAVKFTPAAWLARKVAISPNHKMENAGGRKRCQRGHANAAQALERARQQRQQQKSRAGRPEY